MSKLNRIYKKLDILQDEKENNIITNLTKKPKRDNYENMPHFHNEVPFFSQQADLLFLSDDRSYKYCLVVVDIATRICDAEPLKSKTANEVKNAFIKIYKRKILKFPAIMTFDSGTEFKGVCKTYFENNDCEVKVSEPYRSRQLEQL
jgi:IS30 family transposase